MPGCQIVLTILSLKTPLILHYTSSHGVKVELFLGIIAMLLNAALLLWLILQRATGQPGAYPKEIGAQSGRHPGLGANP